ncbi:MAG TPA: VWA domain-containing protein, partial [Thermoanaerobaculia bacterium]|nr:VWA domain-containing protein [Thermoanaerobaculia bacterium]
MNSSRVVTAAILLLLAAAAGAQDFGETVQIDVIEVPVTVVDRDGHTVRGLTKANFELYDDGKRVPIDYFEAVDIARVTAGAERSESPLPPVSTRNFLLLFDLENSEPGAIGRAQQAAKQFLEGGLTPHDLVAVGIFTAERGAQLLTSFSTDRNLIARAIGALDDPQQFRIADPLMLSALPLEQGARVMDVLQLRDEQTRNAASSRASDGEKRARLRVQLNQLGRVAHVLNRLHGQKQVILLSEGFDARVVLGREELQSQESRDEIDQVFRGEAYKVDSDQRFGNVSARRDVDEMAELFRRSDVVLHAIDIAGLRSDVDASEGYRRSSNESLSLLTAPTGGTVFKNVNDLAENFSRMLRQQEVVYVIGFNARDTGKPGRFHTLKVKTVDAKVARVAHRSGYFETRPDLTELEKTLTLAEIIVGDIPIDDVELRMTTSPMPGPNGKARIPVVIEIPGPDLLSEIKGSTATATLFLYAFDKENRVVDHLQQRIALDLAQAGESIRTSGIRYYGTLRAQAGEYAIKAMVRVEESGRIGFTRTDVPVPAFDRA